MHGSTARKGEKINSGHGPGWCSCPKHQLSKEDSRWHYRENFHKLNGDGPFPCGEKLHGCGEPVMFEDCIVDHVDENKLNNDPENWQPMHKRCHDRKSSLVDGRGERVVGMNAHENNSSEARSIRAKAQHAKRRLEREGRR